jgi:hypothetical protein
MKNLLPIIITVVFTILNLNSKAQGPVFDVVSIGAGYTNQSFYSMANGELSNVSNTDWDMGFQISGFQASIIINSKNNVRLFKSGLDINSWNSITANDTVGVLNPSNELFNTDTSWWTGAFNTTNDLANMFDLGWGVYDLATHFVTGDSLYFMILSTGDVKKVWIQSLQNNTYYFAYADVDGSNEVNTTLNKLNFIDKNFGYYSIINNATVDREPVKYNWDITFMQYMAVTPFIYKVTGVLSNDSVYAAKAYPVDVNTVAYGTQNFSYYINTIGYDWKAYDFNTNSWLIQDSTAYFVYDRNGSLWKMVFTNFGGSLNGNYEFYKELISATGLTENGGHPAVLSMYPNPANDIIRIICYVETYDVNNSINIYNATGQLVKNADLPAHSGLHEINIPVSDLTSGTYHLRSIVDGLVENKALIIVK